MANTSQGRLPATAEFDERLSKLYDKALTEVNRHIRKSIATYKIDITKILEPSVSEQENARANKAFTRKRLKILDSIDTLVKNLVAGRNRVSLFDMFDEKNAMSKSYARRYNRVKMQALNRLETGVSLIKFERQQDMPLSTILFPSRNSKFYVARYELLKHSLLNKVQKGVKNLSFVSETFMGRLKKKFKLERNKAEIPIDAFLIPTPNSNLYTLRYNLAKHRLLSKINAGIKNLHFVTYSAQDVTALNGSKRTKMVPVSKKVDVPIDEFLIPSGNSWLYTARFELAKLKLLSKVKAGIKNIEFTGGEYDIIDKFMPDISSSNASTTVAKAISKAINRESKAKANSVTRSSKINEYQMHKQQERLDKQIKLDEERNRILMQAFFGNGPKQKYKKGEYTDTINKNGTFIPKGVKNIATTIGTSLGPIMKTNMLKAAKAAGPALAVGAAGVIGWEIGQAITRTGWYKKLRSNIEDTRYDAKFDKLTTQYSSKTLTNALSEADPNIVKLYRQRGGLMPSDSRSRGGANNQAKFKRSAKQNQELLISVMEEYYSTNKRTNNSSNDNLSNKQLDELITEVRTSNGLLKGVQGTTIINPKSSPNLNFGYSLDSDYKYLMR